MVYMSGNSVIIGGTNCTLYNSYEHLCNAQNRKRQKPLYQLLLSELDSLGKQASLVTIEIRSLGHWIHKSKCCQDFAQPFSSFLTSHRQENYSTVQLELPFLPPKSFSWLENRITGLKINLY